MKERIMIGVVTLLLAFTFLVPVMAVAEDGATSNMDIVREKVRVDKKLLVASNMGLSESEAKAFWPIYDEYQKELMKLGDRKLKLIMKYAEAHKSMSNEVAKELLDEHLVIEADLQEALRTYLPKFRGALSDLKVARYYQLENKIQAVVNFELAENIPLIH